MKILDNERKYFYFWLTKLTYRYLISKFSLHLSNNLNLQTPPYTYNKESKDKLVGNDRYEGFAIDLIDMLSKKLGFNYIFEVQETYGTKYSNGTLTGMVKDLDNDVSDE